MIFYLTVNEYYSGIYQGQVIDVVRFWQDELREEIRLVVFIPVTGFWKNREQIKSKIPSAIILPMLPKQSIGTRWKQSRFLLYFVCKLFNCKAIIARNPMATWLAISAREKGYVSKVCFDGRGAVAAEAKEYNIYPVEVAKIMPQMEAKAILCSDYQICITGNLLRYWKDEYSFSGCNYYIIPGTLNFNFLNLELKDSKREEDRKKNGYNREDILLIYAGSTEGWQSFQLLYDFLVAQFSNNSSVKMLFLSKEEKNIGRLLNEFPQRVKRLWLAPSEVKDIMLMGDYGLIVRENSVTNNVAFPTKFPEYLACGLSVISTRATAEVADFIERHNCGVLIDDKSKVQLVKNLSDVAAKNRFIALTYFNKYSTEIKSKYISLSGKLKEN